MMLNTIQEAVDIAKGKRKIMKYKKIQDELEKDKIWEPIPDAPGNAKRLKR